MMKRLTDRRRVLLAAVPAAAAVVAGAAAAQAAEIRGTVDFEGGRDIPKGRLAIYLEDGASQDAARSRASGAQIDSDGKSPSIGFTLPQAAARSAQAPAEVVARLERAEDGWLLARGSARLVPGEALTITLFTVMY
jgi:hypothetical protein